MDSYYRIYDGTDELGIVCTVAADLPRSHHEAVRVGPFDLRLDAKREAEALQICRSERHQAVTHFQGPTQLAPLGSGGLSRPGRWVPTGTPLNTARRPGPGQPSS